MANCNASPVITQECLVNGMSQSVDSLDGARWQPVVNSLSLTEVLESLDEIKVHQHLDIVEVCLGWERNNRYSLYTRDDNQILYTYETAQCYARQCYGSLREFTLVITDNDDNRLLYVHRPLKCSSRCFYISCCLQEMTIYVPPDKILAVVRERWTCCLPEFDLEDSEGVVKFKLLGSVCHCSCCCDINFVVKNTSGEEVASIHKEWSGCKDIIGANNDFIIEYLSGLSNEEKVMILGATFLLDFNYFERHRKCF